ncbi:MAG: HU family DNA-binding protein [Bacteroides sp.]|nr:HU family DNA-binding protein [Roseburia sp.]MCM1346081.1 HU family DNA-binding protein [Bacteroides sp.]MCM1420425.1 HU family DNA-binding protein [Bacteroides sp.]
MGKINLKPNYQRMAIKDKMMYITRVVTFSRISATALIDSASRNSSITKGHISASCDAIMNEFQNYLLNGHSVEIPYLGTFRLGVSCKSADKAEDVSANNVYRKKIIFTPSVSFKALLEQCNFEMLGVGETAAADNEGGNDNA